MQQLPDGGIRVCDRRSGLDYTMHSVPGGRLPPRIRLSEAAKRDLALYEERLLNRSGVKPTTRPCRLCGTPGQFNGRVCDKCLDVEVKSYTG